MDDSGDGWASNMTGDEENVSGSGALSCVWPPRDPDSIPDTCVDGSKDFDGTKGSRAGYVLRVSQIQAPAVCRLSARTYCLLHTSKSRLFAYTWHLYTQD